MKPGGMTLAHMLALLALARRGALPRPPEEKPAPVVDEAARDRARAKHAAKLARRRAKWEQQCITSRGGRVNDAPVWHTEE